MQKRSGCNDAALRLIRCVVGWLGNILNCFVGDKKVVRGSANICVFEQTIFFSRFALFFVNGTSSIFFIRNALVKKFQLLFLLFFNTFEFVFVIIFCFSFFYFALFVFIYLYCFFVLLFTLRRCCTHCCIILLL